MIHLAVRKSLPTAVVMFLLFVVSTMAGNIDPATDGQKYAYSENAGWINLAPSHGSGATVEDAKLTGYIWLENIGWIKLDPAFGGVRHDGMGNLSGYAWSENTGWINFSCATNDTCTSVDYGVTIDTTTGAFSGYAWGENIGWIKFDYSGFSNPSGTYAQTSWRMNGDISSNGEVTLEDAIMTLQVGAGVIPASPVHSGADVNEDERIGPEEAAFILQSLSGARTE